MEGESHIYKFDMKREFERIHQKMLTEPEDFVLDKNLSDYVRSLLELSGCNSEASKLREYIDECQRGQNDDTEPASSPQNYRSFVCGMSQYIYKNYTTFINSTDSDPTVWLDQIYVCSMYSLLKALNKLGSILMRVGLCEGRISLPGW